LTKIGANDDAATLSGSLFAGQEYLAAGQTSITDEVLDFVSTGCSSSQEMQLRWNTANAEPEWVCPDTTPNAFDFTDQTLVALSTLTESNILTITGIDVASLVTVSGDGSPQFRICNDSSCSVVDHSWGNNNQNIDGSQSIQLRLTSNAAGSTANTASLAIGGGSDDWIVTTGDVAPTSFAYTDQTAVALSTLTESNILQITGLTMATAVSISGDGTPAYRICSDSACSSVTHTWSASAGSIDNNEYLQLRLTSNAADLTANSASIVVGEGSDSWSVTTGDTAPVAFNYTDQTDVGISVLTESNILQITGITAPTAVSISGDGTPAYRICSDSACSSVTHDWSTSAGSIDNNEYLQLRLTSNASEDTANSASIVVGTGSDSWSVTTGNFMIATGGTITTDGDYKVHTFLSSDTFTVTNLGDIGTVEYLVVAGGGGGGVYSTYDSGGGGAGGFRTDTGYAVTAQAYPITVGAGGSSGSVGSDSIFSSITSSGGGNGGADSASGVAGGSGGGSGYAGTGGEATPAGQGNNGGTGLNSSTENGGGGGGAGAVGQSSPDTSNAGDGGVGLSSSISGASVYYAGGGGGGTHGGSTAGSGGNGGGGNGGYNANGVAGTANTGGGGGGGGYQSTGAAGGSGIVIVRYLYQ
jgi:hypothetical protein